MAEKTFWSLFNTTSEEQQHVRDFVPPRPEICTSMALFWLVDEMIIIQGAPLCVHDVGGENLNQSCAGSNRCNIYRCKCEETQTQQSSNQLDSSFSGRCATNVRPTSIVSRQKRVQIFRKQEQTFFFVFIFFSFDLILLHMLCVRLCVEGQRGHSCWRGANVMPMFTRLQVTVPLTLPGRSSTLAQSLHLTPNTCTCSH